MKQMFTIGEQIYAHDDNSASFNAGRHQRKTRKVSLENMTTKRVLPQEAQIVQCALPFISEKDKFYWIWAIYSGVTTVVFVFSIFEQLRLALMKKMY